MTTQTQPKTSDYGGGGITAMFTKLTRCYLNKTRLTFAGYTKLVRWHRAANGLVIVEI